MADTVAIYILWDGSTCALMEDRPDMRPGTHPYWVYPGGKVEPGESHEAAMLRELTEELPGVTPLAWETLGETFTNPETGWSVAPFVVTEWSGDIPSHTADKRQAKLEWQDVLTIVIIDPDFYSARCQIADRLIERFFGQATLIKP